jgi:hypothetical protein
MCISCILCRIHIVNLQLSETKLYIDTPQQMSRPYSYVQSIHLSPVTIGDDQPDSPVAAPRRTQQQAVSKKRDKIEIEQQLVGLPDKVETRVVTGHKSMSPDEKPPLPEKPKMVDVMKF